MFIFITRGLSTLKKQKQKKQTNKKTFIYYSINSVRPEPDIIVTLLYIIIVIIYKVPLLYVLFIYLLLIMTTY